MRLSLSRYGLRLRRFPRGTSGQSFRLNRAMDGCLEDLHQKGTLTLFPLRSPMLKQRQRTRPCELISLKATRAAFWESPEKLVL